jgi:predicted outer membrane protein
VTTSVWSFARTAALAAMLCSGAALAQNESPDAGTSGDEESVNPHSVDNRNRTPPGAASPEERRSLEQGEEEAPASVRNKDAPKPSRLRRGQLDRLEEDNPHSVLSREKLSPRELVDVLHVSNSSEIAAGKMAQQKGSPPVADYGLMLVISHQAMDEKLKTAAGQMGLKVADQPKTPKARKDLSDSKKMRDKLSQLNGPQFDRAFARSIAAEQRKTIEVVQVARGTCEEAALCSVLDQTLPMLRSHEQGARALEKPPVAQGRRRSPQ